ncbi:hypothetical protein A2U01_0088650, partial [Trifolium medium]|nr:hypothetical protein [Trifolium medium]
LTNPVKLIQQIIVDLTDGGVDYSLSALEMSQ